jgi:DNA-binding NarL/FixJ family response regulator
MIRILLVDDNAIVRRGIASLLAEADGIEVVGEAADGREAIAKAEELRPDVVCLDVRMPVMDGVAAAGPLSQRSKVLMLSYSEDEHLVTGAIRNGAAGYLVHGRFEPDELEIRIKAVARGEMVLSPAVTPAVFDVLRRSPGVSNDEDELGLGSLTAREREVLNLLARGLSNREIAEELVITNKTVKNHLSRIYEKIGVHSRAEAIALWLGVRDSGDSLPDPGGSQANLGPPAPRRLRPGPLVGPLSQGNTDRSQSVNSTQGAQQHVGHHHHSHRRLPRVLHSGSQRRHSSSQPRRRPVRSDRGRVHGHPARRRGHHRRPHRR